MNKKTINDIDLYDKRVIMRVDFNVPIDEEGTITDDTRIQAALPSIQHILKYTTKLVLMSHLGRPEGTGYEERFSLKPVAKQLSQLLGVNVLMAPDCIGDTVTSMVDAMKTGDVILLENTRFHAEETSKVSADQQKMAAQLARFGDVYVNDAFGTAHRAHASTSTITQFVDICVAGLLMDKELKSLGNAIESPERPFVAIIGGAKISGKLDLLSNLIKKVDTLLIGGGMTYTFKKAKGMKIGKSIVEDNLIDTAAETLAAAERLGKKVIIPVDNVIADNFSADANTVIAEGDFPDEWEGVDIGPKTIEMFTKEINTAKTILWNGPMGCFEMKPFSKGTNAVCQAIADSDSVSIIGGGDSVSAVQKAGLADRMSHVSTGGGASLEFLEGKELPGVTALNNK